MIRALVWVLGGLGVLVVVLVATAPELLGDLTGAGGVVGLAFAAGIPGVVLLGALAITRTGRHDQPGSGRPAPSTGRASLTPEDLRRAGREPRRDPQRATRPDAPAVDDRPDDPTPGA